MTATAGMHNLPAVMRPVVAADDGHVLVRADLGQIGPRILAAVSGDEAFIEATQGDDLYLPVAQIPSRAGGSAGCLGRVSSWAWVRFSRPETESCQPAWHATLRLR